MPQPEGSQVLASTAPVSIQPATSVVPGPPAVAPPPGSAAEQLLLDFARRAARQPAMLALVLHLSRLRPPAPRPHHRRIARAMLHEVVQRYGGQVLGLACGDLVLLCPQPETIAQTVPHHAGADATSPYELPAFLARLLRIDAPDPDRLVSLWPLPKQAAELLAYATARSIDPLRAGATPLATPAARSRDAGRIERERATADRAAQTSMLDALATVAEATETADVLRRQTAVLLPSAAADRGTLQPLFREISFSITALEARIGVGAPVRADPYLFRHLAGRLDQRMLETLVAARGSGGPLDPGAAGLPLHLNLGLDAIASPAFDRLADQAGTAAAPHPPDGQVGGGIEVSLMEACADPAAFVAARARVQRAGFQLVLDRVSHLALSLAEIWPLEPDLVKLEWAPAMARLEGSEADALDASLGRIGAARLLLLRADTEAAVRWGMSRSIRRFQGRHVDAMLAASRLAFCSHAGGCTLRQCSERAEASGDAGRRFCRNTRLLDAASPGHAGASAWVREVA